MKGNEASSDLTLGEGTRRTIVTQALSQKPGGKGHKTGGNQNSATTVSVIGSAGDEVAKHCGGDWSGCGSLPLIHG